MTDQPILACDGVRKHFDEAGHRLEVLKDVNLRVGRGDTNTKPRRRAPTTHSAYS